MEHALEPGCLLISRNGVWSHTLGGGEEDAEKDRGNNIIRPLCSFLKQQDLEHLQGRSLNRRYYQFPFI